MSNAVKYSGHSRRIEVLGRKDGSQALVAVRDYGVGIPAYQQAQVFDRFFRAGNVSSQQYSGLGLGLFISHSIIERHNGRIWLESQEGRGSTFYFALPIRGLGSEVGDQESDQV
jgi:signal transduction histidine kinase